MRWASSAPALLLLLVVGATHLAQREVEAAFMAKLPLRVLSVLPSGQQPPGTAGPVGISGRDALTVTFSRAVIALGADFGPEDQPLPGSMTPFTLSPSNIPGRLRWVTTFSARFDPSVDWPTDLTVTLTLNAGLITFDGVGLSSVGFSATHTFTTPALVVQSPVVTSDLAMERTGGTWVSHLESSEGDGVASEEVPPDGVITLRFSHSVDPALIARSLQMRTADTASSGVALDVCACPASAWGASLDTCVAVTLGAGSSLAVDTRYELVLPAGSSYHPLCGLTRTETSFALSGLVGFKLPFLQGMTIPTQEWKRSRPYYRRWKLWVRHGLLPATTVASLASAISVSPALEFNLTILGKDALQMEGEFQPSTEYTITVAACDSCLDGFGLPMAASGSRFQTQQRPTFFLEAGDYQHFATNFQPSAPSTWAVLSQGSTNCLKSYNTPSCSGNPPMYADAFAVEDTDDSIKGALASTCNRHQHFPSRGVPTAGPVQAPMTDDLQEISLPTADLLAQSGLFIHTRWDGMDYNGQYTKTSTFAGSADISATLFVTGTSNLTVWVQSLNSGLELSGATVRLYERTVYDQCQKSSINLLGTATTASSGVASLSISTDNYRSRWAVISYGGKMIVLDNVPRTNNYDNGGTAKGALITDRGMYKIGDTISVKGLVRSISGVNLGIPTGLYELRVQWKANTDPAVHQVDVSQDYGSFSLVLTVPVDAEYKDTQLQLALRYSCDGCRTTTITSTTISVADPRPPTVQLSLKTSDNSLVMDAASTKSLSVDTQTYTGTPVAGAEVTVAWTHQASNNGGRGAFHEATDLSQLIPASAATPAQQGSDFPSTGSLTLVTDSSGHLTHPFAVLGLANHSRHGDEIALTATWVGPTRELITESLTLTLSTSTWELSLSTSPADPLPGYSFGVLADVCEVVGRQSVQGQAVTVKLLQWDEGAVLTLGPDGSPSFAGVPPPHFECTMNSDGGSSLGCPTALPSTGKWALVACIVDTIGQSVCSARLLGKTDDEWVAEPLASLDAAVMMVPDKQEYALLDQPALQFFNPFAAGARAMVHWGNTLSTQTLTTPVLDSGLQNITLPPLGTECDGGCRVMVMLTAPRQSESLTMPVAVTTSPLFDWNGAQAFTSHLTLSVLNNDDTLTVSISVDHAIQTPGSTSGFTISVLDSNNQPTAAEVCIFAVDEAFLDLKPHPALDLTDRFHVSVLPPAPVSSSTSAENAVSAAGYETIKNRLKALVAVEPFLSLSNLHSWPLGPKRNPIEGDLSAYVDSLTSWITRQGCQWCGSHSNSKTMARGGDVAYTESAMMDDAESAPLMASTPGASVSSGSMLESAGESASLESGREQSAPAGFKIPVRSAFETTPLFLPMLAVPSSGSLHVPMPLPDNVGTFKIRAYAIGSGNKFGHADAAQVVRNPLSLVASTPRIVRVGDNFDCGFTVTAADTSFRGEVQVAAVVQSGGLSVRPDGASHIIQIVAAGPHEVRFSFTVPVIEDAELQFTATASVGGDAFTAAIPVLSPQGPVCVATSMAIDATADGAPWPEGIVLPDAVPGSGSLDLSAGVGNLPAVQELAAALLLLSTHPNGFGYMNSNGLELVNSLAPLAMLTPYSVLESEIGGSALTQLRPAFEALSRLTDSDGLRHSLRKPTGYGGPAYINTWLNAWAAYVARRLSTTTVLSSEQTAIAAKWRAALITGLVREAQMAEHNRRTFDNWELLAHARLVLGAGDTWVPADTSNTIRTALSMGVLLEHAQDCSDYCKAASAIALLHSNSAHPSALALLSGIMSKLRVSSRTAYISAGDQGHAADMRTNALFLTATTKVSPLHAAPLYPALLIQKLANYIAQGDASQRWGSVYGGGSNGVSRGLALADYDAFTNSNTPNLELTVTTGGLALLSAAFATGRTDTVTSCTNWSALDSPPAPLNFRAQGTGQVSVAAAMRFVPVQRISAAVYRGLFVERVIQAIDSNSGLPTGAPLRAVELGQMVAVTLQLTTADDLQDVVLEDWTAGGLEPLDPNVGTTPVLNDNSDCGWPRISSGGGGSGSGGGGFDFAAYRWWFSCTTFQRQTRPDQVTYHSTFVKAGTHSVSYQAMASTSGSWVLPPAKAFVLLQPELMGMSASGTFNVSRTALTAAERHFPLPSSAGPRVPVDCPEACLDDCDVFTGACNPQLTLLTRAESFDSLDNTNVPPPVVVLPKIRARLVLALDIATIPPDSAARASFVEAFAADVGAQLGVGASRIIVNSIASGSVVVGFSILPDPTTGEEIALSVLNAAFSDAGVSIAGSTTALAIEITAFGDDTPSGDGTAAEGTHGLSIAVTVIAIALAVLCACAVWRLKGQTAATTAEGKALRGKASHYTISGSLSSSSPSATAAALSSSISRDSQGDDEGTAMLDRNPIVHSRSRTPP